MVHLTLVPPINDEIFTPPKRDWCRHCGAQDDGTFRYGGDTGVPVEDTDDIGYLQCETCTEEIIDSEFAFYLDNPPWYAHAPRKLDRAGFVAWLNTLPPDEGDY